MNFTQFYLNEMLVIGKPKNGDFVLAFDKWIFILDDKDPKIDDIKSKIVDTIRDDMGLQDYEVERWKTKDDLWDFISNIAERYQDILVGQISGKNLYLNDYGAFKFDPKSSILVKKVVAQLGLSSASYIEDLDSTETKVSKKKMLMQIPSVGFHGTSSIYFKKIMRTGLRPGQADSNYADRGIYHDDLIFFATRFGEAMHHSITTSENKGGVPIVIEFKIADKDAIVADYDVEKATGTDRYYTNLFFNKSGNPESYTYIKDPDRLSREFGIYGYRGRIPSSFFTKVYYTTKPIDKVYSVGDFKKTTPKQLMKLIDYGYFDF